MSHRMLQVNENIQRELSRILIEDFEWDGALVTLTQVWVMPDLRTGTAWVSVLNAKDPMKAIDQLNSRTQEIFHLLAPRLRMKNIPKLEFKLDEQGEEIEKIDELIDVIHGEDHAA